MMLSLTPRTLAALLALGATTLFHTPARASQDNLCKCLVTESSPCSCTKNWKISPLATHHYWSACDVDGDGKADFEVNGYSISYSLNGRAKNTTCLAPVQPVYGGVPEMSYESYCTNWSVTKKDSTSTVVTCRKD